MNNPSPKYSSEKLKELLLNVYASQSTNKKKALGIGGAILFFIWATLLIFIEDLAYLSIELKVAGLLFAFGFSLFVPVLGWKSAYRASFIDFYRSFSSSTKLKELTYALDLENSQNAHPKLVEAAIFKNLEAIDPEVLVSKLKEYQRNFEAYTQYLLRRNLALASFAILLISGFSMNEAGGRLLQFWKTFEKPNPYSYSITPGTIAIEQGMPFSASIEFEGDVPKDVALMLKTDVEEQFRTYVMEKQGQVFSSIPIDLNSDIVYYIKMDEFRSELFNANVQLVPRFTNLAVTVVPPTYTNLDSTTHNYPFSLIQGYQGSEFTIKGSSNKELNILSINRSSATDTIPLAADLHYEYRLEITKSDTISFLLVDENGLKNENPFRFVIEPILDSYPTVDLLEPSESFEAVDPKTIELLFRPSDDFALTGASLNYELKKAFVDNIKKEAITLDHPGNGKLQSFVWDVLNLGLTPKDRLTFWIEVSDNDGYNGFKSTKSQTIELSVPSLIDYFDDIGKQENEVQSDLEDISESFEEMREQYDEFKEQLKENPKTNFEQLRQLEEVQNQQKEIEERIEELNKKFEEIKEELSENSMLSEETLKAYEELKKLMEEIDDPAFREALEKLQEQMSEMNPEQLRDALKEAEFNEELYKKRLERTLELFKQLKLNSDLEKLAQAYEDLARQEEELESENVSEESLEEQRKSTLEQTERLKNQLEELSENTTDKTEKQIQNLQELSETQLKDIQEQIEKMLKELKNQENQEGSDLEKKEGEEGSNNPQQQQNFKQEFKQLAEATRQTMLGMNQQQMNINVAGLQYILHSLLNLSIMQEDLVTYASSTENRSQAYIEYARDQKNVEDIFKSLSDSLYQLSTEIPQFSNQINTKKQEVEERLISSLEQMAERNQNQASVATRQALGGINEIAFMIANLLEQVQDQQNGGGSGGSMSMQQMMEQMKQMGENQQQLNQQMQDFINDMQGERLTQDQMERLNQLSKQQNQIRQQLQQFQQNGDLEGGDKLGSDMERMIEEMEDTINDLRGGAVDPTLIERQQNILSRMLEAETAMQERDEEEKREGTTGTKVTRPTPPELTLEELEKQIRSRLNDPNFTKYSTDYQRLIEHYFELLKEIQGREIR